MAISAQQLTIYLYSAHRAVIFAIAQLSCLKGDIARSIPSIIFAKWQHASRSWSGKTGNLTT